MSDKQRLPTGLQLTALDPVSASVRMNTSTACVRRIRSTETQS